LFDYYFFLAKIRHSFFVEEKTIARGLEVGELVDFDEVVEVGDELDLVGLQGGEEKEVVRRRKKSCE